ncbi:bifunctional 3'-5' exonuclease/DNA polymerase [Georgenia alba]|uniref:DNA-directed DNA polymerase n=1 Tax=Georgenia alba TaxID=2233858 RepID=A0ABW2Q4W0_9MICO
MEVVVAVGRAQPDEPAVLTGAPDGPEEVPVARLPARIAELESRHRPRWVWADTARLYPHLLDAGVRVARCHDLRLCRRILAAGEHGREDHDSGGAGVDLGQAHGASWEAGASWEIRPAHEPTLLDGLEQELGPAEVAAEHARQREVVAACPEPGRLRLLLAAESAGALVAAEMRHDGLPWDRAAHDRILTEILGPRPPHGSRPALLEELAGQIRTHLSAPSLNPDSPSDLLRALNAAGIEVGTTRKWELNQVRHPAIPPLLEYKKLARLLTANGWAWLEEWVHPVRHPGPGTGRELARFRPEYVVAGVVTGRWATSGGGALQLPKQVRGAVVADPGWRFVVADAAQLEPRVLAAMARDEGMAAAARGIDLYQGLVDQGIVDTRAHAKVAMLGALYGSTSGEAGRLMPRLLRAYPRATGVVEAAARTGEQGGTVRTWLGRRSPDPPPAWREAQRGAAAEGAAAEEVRRARQLAREWGRFTRNFVVQGTAAEWALCWLADVRGRLRALAANRGPWSGPGADVGPHLVFFLHDEVVVHTPADLAEEVAEAVRAAAAAAGRLLFGDFPIEFPLDVAVVETYADAA